MATKTTIYKFTISLSDIDRGFYDTLNLTVAQHPSENLERMMMRVIAYCLNAQPRLSFTKGLSSPDEPDIWLRTLDNRLDMWIDVGEPAVERIKKATHQAETVKVYSFNTKSPIWWSQNKNKLSRLLVSVYQFDFKQLQMIASYTERTMEMSVTITGESAYVATGAGECELDWSTLLSSEG